MLTGPEESQTSPRRLDSGRLRRAGRFTRWQLYRLLAGGSRESPNAMFCPSRLFVCRDTTAHRTTAPRDVPGSRLLLTDRAAILQSGLPDVASRSLNDGAQSGSPPGLGMRRRVP